MSIDGGVELSQAIAESGLGHACFVRSYFRFAMARKEDVQASEDGCALETLRKSLIKENGGYIEKMFRAAASLPEMRIRKFN